EISLHNDFSEIFKNRLASLNDFDRHILNFLAVSSEGAEFKQLQNLTGLSLGQVRESVQALINLGLVMSQERIEGDTVKIARADLAHWVLDSTEKKMIAD